MLSEKRGEKGKEKKEERRTKVELRRSLGNVTGKQNCTFSITYYKGLV